MKFGFDVHGVLDTHMVAYSNLLHTLSVHRHEVHVITGVYECDREEVQAKLLKAGVKWTHWFSVPEFLLESGVPSIGTSRDGHLKWAEGDWDRVKAQYCNIKDIDMMFDDSPHYGQYFNGKTIFMLQRDPKSAHLWDALTNNVESKSE